MQTQQRVAANHPWQNRWTRCAGRTGRGRSTRPPDFRTTAASRSSCFQRSESSSGAMPSTAEILRSTFFRDKQQVGQMVGQDTVDFFGHAPVQGTQAGTTWAITGASPSCVERNLRSDQGASHGGFTSPKTTTKSGFNAPSSTVSKLRMISAVCTACEPEPTPSWMSG